MNIEKAPPHSQEAEQSVLGAILLQNATLPRIAQMIRPEDFYIGKNQQIFRAMLALYAKMHNVDIVTLVEYLEQKKLLDDIGGPAYLAGIMNNTPTASGVMSYAKIVKSKARLRKLITTGQQVVARAYEEENPDKIVEQFSSVLIDAGKQEYDEKVDVKDAIQKFLELQKQYSEARKHGKDILGHSTGFKPLDSITEGFREQHLWVVGGYSSVGKTYFSLNMVRQLLKQGKRVVFYSLEMSEVDIIARLLAIGTGIPPQMLYKESLSKSEYLQYLDEKNWLESTKLTIHTKHHSLGQIKMSMIEEMLKEKVDVFFLDYIQLVTHTGNEYDDMRIASTDFQALMKRFNTPLVMLSQLSNEAAKNPNAYVIGLKGSGSIVAAADYVIELTPGEQDLETYRTKLATGKKVLIHCNVKKNRNGRTGRILVYFSSYTGVFEAVTD